MNRVAGSESLCVALDSPDPVECERLAKVVEPYAGLLKVGPTAFAAGGPDLVTSVLARRPVFLDLKLHDIPAQVAGAVQAASSLGVSHLTVHASGGRDMVEAACGAAGRDTTILAVTVLTSMDDDELRRTGIAGGPLAQVLRLAELALSAGVGGLVSSPLEVGALRSRFGARADGGPLLVVPGVRGPGSGPDDQRRTLPARAALEAGADVLVVGRAITGADDPASAARLIARELGG